MALPICFPISRSLSQPVKRIFAAPPANAVYSDKPAYVHFTSNNTIFGTQWPHEPEAGVHKLICDASSDIFSRPIDISRYGLIYAGAQKNLGPSGVVLVITTLLTISMPLPVVGPSVSVSVVLLT